MTLSGPGCGSQGTRAGRSVAWPDGSRSIGPSVAGTVC